LYCTILLIYIPLSQKKKQRHYNSGLLPKITIHILVAEGYCSVIADSYDGYRRTYHTFKVVLPLLVSYSLLISTGHEVLHYIRLITC